MPQQPFTQINATNPDEIIGQLRVHMRDLLDKNQADSQTRINTERILESAKYFLEAVASKKPANIVFDRQSCSDDFLQCWLSGLQGNLKELQATPSNSPETKEMEKSFVHWISLTQKELEKRGIKN